MINIVIFISIFIIGISLYFGCYKVNILEFNSNKKGKNILLIAGTHGNEPSGVYALNILIKHLINNSTVLKSGKITIIKNLNKCGHYVNTRNYSNVGKKYDLNRLYGKNFIVNKQVEKIIEDTDIILDFHEGWGYIGKDKSIGSSLTFSKNINKNVRDSIIELLNENITVEYKKFRESNAKIIPYSLRDYANKINKEYVLIETTGQNNIQHLSIRINQCLVYIAFFLKHYEII